VEPQRKPPSILTILFPLLVALFVIGSCRQSGDGSARTADEKGQQASKQAKESPKPTVPSRTHLSEPATPVLTLPSAAGPSAPSPALPVPSEVTVEELNREALGTAESVVRQFPHDADSFSLMGNVCFGQGDARRAIENWNRCLELGPHRALEKGEHEQASALARKALELDPNLPGVRRSLASAMMYLGRPAEAVPLLEEEADLIPESAKTCYLLGQAYFQLKDYEQAKKNYQRVMEIQPDHKNACYGLAMVCAKLGEVDRARQYRQRFQQIKANDLQALIDETRAYDDLAAARRRLAEAHTLAGQAFFKHGAASQAVEHWQRAAALDGENAACRVLLAQWHQYEGRESEALRVWEQLAAIEPENVEYHRVIGALHAHLRQFDRAEEAFRKVIELAPEDSAGYENLAKLYLYAKKKYSDAQAFAKAAVRLRPNVWNYALLSEACDKAGDRVGALAAMEQVVALDPDSVKFQRALKRLRERK